MDLHLKDKVIIVSGGAKGIGRAICDQLVEEGARAVILDKDEEAGRKAAQSKGIHFISIDLNDPIACEGAVASVIKTQGRLDGLVNNAGRNDGIGLATGSPEHFMKSLQNNVAHYFFLAHFALPHLKTTKGSIVNIASKVAVTGQGNTSGYAAAKGAVLALTRDWAVELIPFGIRVNAVLPAEVWTPL